MRYFWSVIITTGLLAGCANPINEVTARRYYAAGDEAARAGNLAAARENYRRALINAQIGHLGPAAEAAAARKLARIQGNLCEREEAEKTFLYALAAEEKAFGSNAQQTFPTRLEIAQYTFDTDQFDKSVTYFEKAFTVGEPILSAKQPLAMALLLDDYAIALEKVGRTLEAGQTRRKAAELRMKGGESTVVKSKDNYTPYPKTCK